jgi:hypothetical protein
MYPLLFIHICAGVIAFPSGVAALFLRKGSRTHRLSGDAFAVSMLVMTGAGAYIATFIKPLSINVIAGTLTFYLVATSWLTVLRKGALVGRAEYAFAVMSALVVAFCALMAWKASHSATGDADGAPMAAYIVFGTVALLAVIGDISVFARRGVSGTQRLARHLWRMCISLCLATVSLFLGTPNRVLVPQFIRETSLRFIPVLLVVATTLFWVVRVWWLHSRKQRARGQTHQGGSSPPQIAQS